MKKLIITIIIAAVFLSGCGKAAEDNASDTGEPTITFTPTLTPTPEPTIIVPQPPEYQENQLQAGVYPEEWADAERVTFIDFNNALKAADSNQKLQGTDEYLENVEFAIIDGDNSVTWNNGAVTIGLLLITRPTPEILAKYSISAWHTYNADPTTGIASTEKYEFTYSTDSFMIDNELGMSTEFAKQLWDAIVLVDTVVSLEDLVNAQSAFPE